MTTDKPNLRTLKALIKLANENKLDVLEFGSIKIVKSKHLIEQPEQKKPAPVKEYNNPLYASEEEEKLWNYQS